jgi:hypothetical protein
VEEDVQPAAATPAEAEQPTTRDGASDVIGQHEQEQGQQALPMQPDSFAAADLDGDGAIDRTEFDMVAAAEAKRQGGDAPQSEDQAGLFEAADVDGDGTIDRAEFDMESAAEVRHVAAAQAHVEQQQQDETAAAIAAMADADEAARLQADQGGP